MATEELVAADKVALIVSNRTYAPQMTNLITPHCDAETLADALQQLKFKTVTLGDLNLAEMKAIVREYRKLLGEGVYGMLLHITQKISLRFAQPFSTLSVMALKPMAVATCFPLGHQQRTMGLSIVSAWTG